MHSEDHAVPSRSLLLILVCFLLFFLAQPSTPGIIASQVPCQLISYHFMASWLLYLTLASHLSAAPSCSAFSLLCLPSLLVLTCRLGCRPNQSNIITNHFLLFLPFFHFCFAPWAFFCATLRLSAANTDSTSAITPDPYHHLLNYTTSQNNPAQTSRLAFLFLCFVFRLNLGFAPVS